MMCRRCGDWQGLPTILGRNSDIANGLYTACAVRCLGPGTFDRATERREDYYTVGRRDGIRFLAAARARQWVGMLRRGGGNAQIYNHDLEWLPKNLGFQQPLRPQCVDYNRASNTRNCLN
jgi:hypothetical protein